jgi:enamine deaminase RidA (YjgF/YER057c/UK114 family)
MPANNVGGTMTRQTVSSGTPWEALAGYARAVKVAGHIYVSGTTASNAAGEVQCVGDAAGQTTYILEKIEAALQQLGVDRSAIVRTRVFVREISDWPAVARAHGAFFHSVRPANTLVRAEPIEPTMLVEIEVDAYTAEH